MKVEALLISWSNIIILIFIDYFNISDKLFIIIY
jgi:hypothetical protein